MGEDNWARPPTMQGGSFTLTSKVYAAVHPITMNLENKECIRKNKVGQMGGVENIHGK